MNSQEFNISNFEAEAGVIGSVLKDSSVMDEVASLLENTDFYHEANRLIWTAMVHNYQNGQPIDFITMSDTFMTYDRLDEVGGIDYLTKLTNAVPSSGAIKHYAELVREKSLRRKMLLISEKIRKLAIESDDIRHATSEFEKLSLSMGVRREMVSVKDIRQEYFEHLKKQKNTILTGFKEFDEWSGGVGRGWLYILAGRPSVGKTAKALQMAMGMAKQNAGDVLIWSQEMGRNQVLDRMVCTVVQLNYNRVLRKMLEEHEMERAVRAYDWLEKLPLHIDDASGVTIEEIRSEARRMKRKTGKLGAIVIDYLGIMNIPQKPNQSRQQAIGEVTRSAKQLARELDCPIIMLAQMSRAGAQVTEPELHHLKESGDIEQDADVVEFLYENEEIKDLQNGVGVISKIAKGRETGVRKFKYRFEGWYQRYKSEE